MRLSEKGYDVTGFDYSEEQLKLARRKAEEKGVSVDFHHGDIRDFHFGTFDAVISLYAPIMFACRCNKELTQAVNCIKKSLNPEGIAFVETPTSKMMNSNGLEVNKHAEKGFKIARVAFYDFNKENNSASVKCVYVSKKKGGGVGYDEAEANHTILIKRISCSVLENVVVK